MNHVLVVDDVPAMAEQYAYDLRRLGGFETRTAGGGREALAILEVDPIDCIILDLEMPGMDGFDLLRTLRERQIDIPVIVYTGTGSYERCVQAVRLGAFNFIDKAEPLERVVREVENALERSQLTSRVRALEDRLGDDTPLIGGSEPMRRLKEAIARLAPIPSPVLIVGESGTGKELVARELHRHGRQPDAPFVAVNSAALPENLVESELFGHERGAFTGAHRTHKGAFEAAGRGTLFLDEIGELPPPTQAKLLRVLEEREVTRVGGTRTIPVEARVVAATLRDLEADVEEGRFRQDLLFRLNVHVIHVPPLRERISDLPELVRHFLDTLSSRLGVRRPEITPAAVDVLMAYDWRRNNVRELRNVVERMLITTEGLEIRAGHVPAEIGGGAGRAAGGGRGWDAAGEGGTGATAGGGADGDAEGGRAGATGADGNRDGGPRTYQDRKTEAERRILVESLERNEWHITNTAAELGLADHSSLLKIMRRHGLSREGSSGI